MGDADKDFRYMALTDLMSELQKESLSLDSDTEEKARKISLFTICIVMNLQCQLKYLTAEFIC